jgi:hypothetical protein
MRILPHDSNTGGFYLALFKKTANINWGKFQTQEESKLDEDDDLKVIK